MMKIQFFKDRPFAVFAAVVCVLMALLLCFKRDNVFKWIRSGISISRQEKVKAALIEENAELERRIQTLSSDRDSLEKFARETYLFSEPEEDVYLEEK